MLPSFARFPVPARAAAIPLAVSLLLLSACAELPTVGPNRRDVVEASGESVDKTLPPVAVVDIDEPLVRKMLERQSLDSFAAAFGNEPPQPLVVGLGDTLEVTIWETPPATLFQASSIDAHVTGTAGTQNLPGQVVDRSGSIHVPFAGRIAVVGRSPVDIAEDIAKKLDGKANRPQVLVKVATNASSTVAVVGEVGNNLRMPLTAAGERVLDALAAAGALRQPVTKTTLQLTRGKETRTMALDRIVRDPAQNIVLRPGDVIAVLSQPYSYTMLGASVHQQENQLEAQGITLAQALGRGGGLQDLRADPAGIFVFRFESPESLPASAITVPPGGSTAPITQSGRVPVVYRLDLRNPRSFFAMQDFPIRDRDIVYISNAPSTDLEKLLNLVFVVNRQAYYTSTHTP